MLVINRRSFFATVGAVMCAPFLPKVPAAKPLTRVISIPFDLDSEAMAREWEKASRDELSAVRIVCTQPQQQIIESVRGAVARQWNKQISSKEDCG